MLVGVEEPSSCNEKVSNCLESEQPQLHGSTLGGEIQGKVRNLHVNVKDSDSPYKKYGFPFAKVEKAELLGTRCFFWF